MEKAVVTFGFAIFCLFFMVGFVVSNIWLWGCVVGLAILAFGWFFWDE